MIEHEAYTPTLESLTKVGYVQKWIIERNIFQKRLTMKILLLILPFFVSSCEGCEKMVDYVMDGINEDCSQDESNESGNCISFPKKKKDND